MKWVNLEHSVLRKASAGKFCEGSLKELLCTGQTILDTSQLRDTESQGYISHCSGHNVVGPYCTFYVTAQTCPDVLATKAMPGILARRQQDWQRGAVYLACWSKETWSCPFNQPTKCSSEQLLWNQYYEKLCIIHLILCCYRKNWKTQTCMGSRKAHLGNHVCFWFQ